jgi:hypothetical protein
MRRHLQVSLFILLVGILGCGRGNPLARQAISGHVTIDGAALDQGMIEFSPESGRGIASGAPVKDGAYSIPTAKGLPPGKYVVRINSTVLDPSKKDGITGIERLAPTYNVQSKIVVEVVAGGTTTFDFQTKSK